MLGGGDKAKTVHYPDFPTTPSFSLPLSCVVFFSATVLISRERERLVSCESERLKPEREYSTTETNRCVSIECIQQKQFEFLQL